MHCQVRTEHANVVLRRSSQAGPCATQARSMLCPTNASDRARDPHIQVARTPDADTTGGYHYSWCTQTTWIAGAHVARVADGHVRENSMLASHFSAAMREYKRKHTVFALEWMASAKNRCIDAKVPGRVSSNVWTGLPLHLNAHCDWSGTAAK